MSKYKDRTKSRLPSDIDYIESETSAERHSRRLEINKANAEVLRSYCKSNGFSFAMFNEGNHWQIKKGKLVLGWHPSTAKLIVNKKWKHGIHVHDIKQIKSYLTFIKLL